MKRTFTLIVSTITLTAAVTGLAASPASATHDSTGMRHYVKAQASRDFTVYAPTATMDLSQTSFQSVPCAGSSGKGISSDYGSQGSGDSPWIGLQESPGKGGCVDGPDGIARTPVATFRVNGAKVTVGGRCPNIDKQSICEKSSPALFKTSGYTTVTLPGSAARPIPTYIEIYSQQMSVDEIRRFVRSLVPVS